MPWVPILPDEHKNITLQYECNLIMNIILSIQLKPFQTSAYAHTHLGGANRMMRTASSQKKKKKKEEASLDTAPASGGPHFIRR